MDAGIGPRVSRAVTVAGWLLASLAALGLATRARAGGDERWFWRDVKPSGVHVAVVGATSRSAAHFMPQALAAGHDVLAIARRPETLKFRNGRLRVAAADVYDVASLRSALAGNEVVVSFIGIGDPDVSKEVPPTDLYSTAAGNLVAAMKARGNRRLLFTTSMGLTIEPPVTKPDGSDPRMMYFWNVREIYNDERRAEAIVRDSGLDFVLLRPAFIVQQPSRGYTIVRQKTPYPINPVITYADFATFTLEQVTGDTYIGMAVGIDDGRVFRITPKGLVYD